MKFVKAILRGKQPNRKQTIFEKLSLLHQNRYGLEKGPIPHSDLNLQGNDKNSMVQFE